MTARLLLLATFACLATAVSAQQPVLRVGGAVARPLALSRADVGSMRHQAVVADAGDQRGEFGGVALMDLLMRAGVAFGDDLEEKDLMKYVVVSGADGNQVTFALAELDTSISDRIILLADTRDGGPLPADAAPYQVVVPGERRPARWVRKVFAIDVFNPGRR